MDESRAQRLAAKRDKLEKLKQRKAQHAKYVAAYTSLQSDTHNCSPA